MSLQNLTEDFLFERLPEGIINLDDSGLISAVVGGIQDRFEDLRSAVSKYELFWGTEGLPEEGDNSILVQFTSNKGKVVTRTLDIKSDTPVPSEGEPALIVWAAAEMQLGSGTEILSAVYGQDLLRLVDANTLQYLAGNLGAILYTTAAQDPTQELQDARRLLGTWFPRLKFKGTALSFEALGKALGFEDVRMIPLWTRMSPRLPNDIGSDTNDPDFRQTPEFNIQQEIGNFYDPLDLDDGPFVSWTGTVVDDPTNSIFYTQVINGFNPFFEVSVTGTDVNDIALSDSPVTLTGGAHMQKATASPEGTGLLFTALAEGDSFNGLEINFAALNEGTGRVISVTDRLSSLKYRSSYYDLAITLSADRYEELYGSVTVLPNSDLVDDATMANFGTAAVSPYLAWGSGSILHTTTTSDYLTSVSSAGSITIIDPRSQLLLTDRQYDVGPLLTAGDQVTDAFEEVRAATRLPRDTSVGFLQLEPAHYAKYTRVEDLFVSTVGSVVYNGTTENYPVGGYTVDLKVSTGGSTVLMTSEEVSDNQDQFTLIDPSVTAIYTYGTHGYQVNFDGGLEGVIVEAQFTPTTTEFIRPEPSSGTVAYQARPEDQFGTVRLDVSDYYPWRREVVGGGELVDLSFFQAVGNETVERVEPGQSAFGQDGVEYNVYGIRASGTHPVQITSGVRPYNDYVPAHTAVAFTGDFRNIAGLSAEETQEFHDRIVGSTGVTNSIDDLDRVLESGYSLYNYGLVHGVPVADLPGFNGSHHRDGLQNWMTFNEHVEADLGVSDNSSVSAEQTTYGISPDNRVYDAKRGWYLDIPCGGTVQSDFDRKFTGEDYAMSLWIRPGLPLANTRLVEHGPLSIDIKNLGLLSEFYWKDTDGNDVLVGSQPLVQSQFTCIYLSKSGGDFITGQGDLMRSLTEDSSQLPTYSEFGDDVPIKLKSPNCDSQSQVTQNKLLDIMFIIDVSGSMGTVIANLKSEILTFNSAFVNAGFDVRYGLTTFGNPGTGGDTLDFLDDLLDFVTFTLPGSNFTTLATGVGFTELEHSAISYALANVTWRAGSVRNVMIFGDEPAQDGPTEVTQARSDLTANSAILNTIFRAFFMVPLDIDTIVQTAEEHGGDFYEINDFILDATPFITNFIEMFITSVSGGDGVGIHDFRVWNTFKTITDLNKVRYHNPSPTAAHYRLGWIELLNDRDRYSMKVLPSGYLEPTVLPAWVRTPQLGRVNRYNYEGQYAGASRQKETGLGGGKLLPQSYSLGDQFYTLTAAGNTVVSTSEGQLPGTDQVWEENNVAGDYLVLQQVNKTTSGIVDSYASTGTTVPWPNIQESTNPTRDRVWVKGDDSIIYEVMLEMGGSALLPTWTTESVFRDRSLAELALNDIAQTVDTSGSVSVYPVQGTVQPLQVQIQAGTSVTTDNGLGSIISSGQILGGFTTPSGEVSVITQEGVQEITVIHPANLLFSEQPTGAEVVLSGTSPNGILSIDSNAGTVYQSSYSGSRTTPPLYLYTHERVISDFDTEILLANWIDPNAYGLGLEQPAPALDDNGVLSFINTSSLPAGNYRLTIDSENIGILDDDFRGFEVEITIGSNVIVSKLLETGTGYNFSGEDLIDLEIDAAITGSWLLTLRWKNHLIVSERGHDRNLKITGYKIERLTTDLWQVAIGAGNLDISMMDITSNNGDTAGGYLVSLNSYGSISNWTHEGSVYPSNETYSSKTSLANVLTGATNEKLSDIVINGSFQLKNPGAVGFPVYTGINVT